ncbi:MAG: hypothetical protein LC674_01575, partial [Actinobacteria bacterium]|nr:hypothetical protein [Actinomycetota bacterium]
VSVLARDRPGAFAVAIWAAWSILGSAGIAAWSAAEHRVVRRWLGSWWQYQRMQSLVLALLAAGFLIVGLRRLIWHGGDLLGVISTWPVLLLLAWLSRRERPTTRRNAERASGARRSRAARFRAPPEVRSLLSRHPSFGLFLVFVGMAAVVGLLALIPEPGARFVQWALFALTWALALHAIRAERKRSRRRQALGFDPDYYLAVERRLSKQPGRPELLIYKPTKHPEYSGWYAYASEQDLGSKDLITWSVEDLVEHAPEAALPLRHGHGRWRWDHAQHAYQPI